MADTRKVTITLEAKNLKETLSDTSKLNKELDKAAKPRKISSRAASAALSSASEEATISTGLGRGTAASSQRGESRDFARQAQGLGGLVHVYATFAANIFAVTAAFQALSKAMDFERMLQSSERLAAVTGANIQSLSKSIFKLTEGAISYRDAIQQVNLASVAGFSSNQIKDLTKVAKGASAALGRDLFDAMDRLFRGTVKLEPELLDELGILTRADDAYKAYAVNIGKSVTALTKYEKTQAFLNAVIAEGTQKFGALNNTVAANPFNQLLASIQNVGIQGLSLVNSVLSPIVKMLSESPTALAAAIGLIIKSLLTQAIPSLGKFADTARIKGKEALEEQKRLAEQVELFNKNTAESFRKYKDVELEAAKINYSKQKAMYTDLAKSIQGSFAGSNAIQKIKPEDLFDLKNEDINKLTSRLTNQLNASIRKNTQLKDTITSKVGGISQEDISKLDAYTSKINLAQTALLGLAKADFSKLIEEFKLLEVAEEEVSRAAEKASVSVQNLKSKAKIDLAIQRAGSLQTGATILESGAGIRAFYSQSLINYKVYSEKLKGLVEDGTLSTLSSVKEKTKFIGGNIGLLLASTIGKVFSTALAAFSWISIITLIGTTVIDMFGGFAASGSKVSGVIETLNEDIKLHSVRMTELDSLYGDSISNVSSYIKYNQLLGNSFTALSSSFSEAYNSYQEFRYEIENGAFATALFENIKSALGFTSRLDSVINKTSLSIENLSTKLSISGQQNKFQQEISKLLNIGSFDSGAIRNAITQIFEGSDKLKQLKLQDELDKWARESNNAASSMTSLEEAIKKANKAVEDAVDKKIYKNEDLKEFGEAFKTLSEDLKKGGTEELKRYYLALSKIPESLKKELVKVDKELEKTFNDPKLRQLKLELTIDPNYKANFYGSINLVKQTIERDLSENSESLFSGGINKYSKGIKQIVEQVRSAKFEGGKLSVEDIYGLRIDDDKVERLKRSVENNLKEIETNRLLLIDNIRKHTEYSAKEQQTYIDKINADAKAIRSQILSVPELLEKKGNAEVRTKWVLDIKLIWEDVVNVVKRLLGFVGSEDKATSAKKTADFNRESRALKGAPSLLDNVITGKGLPLSSGNKIPAWSNIFPKGKDAASAAASAAALAKAAKSAAPKGKEGRTPDEFAGEKAKIDLLKEKLKLSKDDLDLSKQQQSELKSLDISEGAVLASSIEKIIEKNKVVLDSQKELDLAESRLAENQRLRRAPKNQQAQIKETYSAERALIEANYKLKEKENLITNKIAIAEALVIKPKETSIKIEEKNLEILQSKDEITSTQVSYIKENNRYLLEVLKLEENIKLAKELGLKPTVEQLEIQSKNLQTVHNQNIAQLDQNKILDNRKILLDSINNLLDSNNSRIGLLDADRINNIYKHNLELIDLAYKAEIKKSEDINDLDQKDLVLLSAKQKAIKSILELEEKILEAKEKQTSPYEINDELLARRFKIESEKFKDSMDSYNSTLVKATFGAVDTFVDGITNSVKNLEFNLKDILRDTVFAFDDIMLEYTGNQLKSIIKTFISTQFGIDTRSNEEKSLDLQKSQVDYLKEIALNTSAKKLSSAVIPGVDSRTSNVIPNSIIDLFKTQESGFTETELAAWGGSTENLLKSGNLSEKSSKVFNEASKTIQDSSKDFKSAGATIADSSNSLLDSVLRLFGSVGGILGNSVSYATSGITSGLGSLFSGSSVFSGGSSGSSSIMDTIGLAGSGFNLFGFAKGGAFEIPGSGSSDSKLVQFMATPGEKVTVETPKQQKENGSSNNVTINNNFTISGGTTNRESQAQISAKVGLAIQRAMSRNN